MTTSAEPPAEDGAGPEPELAEPAAAHPADTPGEPATSQEAPATESVPDDAPASSEASATPEAPGGEEAPSEAPAAAPGGEAATPGGPAGDTEAPEAHAAPAASGGEAAIPAALGGDTAAPESPTGDAATRGKVAAYSGAGGEGGGISGEPVRRRSYRWLKVLGAVTAFFVLAGAGGLWYLYQQLNGNITTDHVTENELKVHASERPTQGPTSAENILLIGSDNRGAGNEKYGADSGTQRSDTVILLHIAADRHSATAMSIPRDLMSQVPACTKPKGGQTEPKFEQFNWAFQFGGAACTIRTVEDMTGIRIDHHLIVDFSGFKKIVNAIGGVDVCLAEPVHDKQAHLNLPAGKQTLNGEQALGYVRARHGLGDGSDTQRMDRQQGFLGSLFSKVSSSGVLLNPTKVYPVLEAATSSLTADPGLDSLKELYGLAREIQGIPKQQVRFLTLPREQYTLDRNRDQLEQPAADQLFTALRDDVAVSVSADGHPDPADTSASPTGTPTGTSTGTATTSPGSTPTAPASPGATYRGTTAATDICGKAAK